MGIARQLEVALDVLRREGVRSAVSKSAGVAFRKTRDAAYSLPVVDRVCYERSLAELRSLQADESDVNDVIRTAEGYTGHGVYRNITAAYNGDEIAEVIDRLEAIEPETVLEIGAGNGGSMYIWTRALRPDRFLSLDIGYGHHPNKTDLFAAYDEDTEFTFLRRISQRAETRELVEDALNGDAVDFLFIDGDHTYEGVRRDFELYHDLVTDGGAIALHDIVPKDNPRMGAPRFYREIRDDYRCEEIVHPPDSAAGGTGLLYL